MQKDLSYGGSLNKYRAGEDKMHPSILREIRLRRLFFLVGIGALGLLCISGLKTMTQVRTPRYMIPCELFGGEICQKPPPPPLLPPPRVYTDEEVAMQVLASDILTRAPSKHKPKIAFMFLTAGPLPFESVWEKFFEVNSSLIRVTLGVFGAGFVHVQPDHVPKGLLMVNESSNEHWVVSLSESLRFKGKWVVMPLIVDVCCIYKLCDEVLQLGSQAWTWTP